MVERKVAFITGASRGIGRAVAVAAASMDYDFFLTGRNESALEETVKVVRKAAAKAANDNDKSRFGCGEGPLIVLHTEDLSCPEAAERLFEAFSRSFDRLDLLVNNAGIVGAKPVGDYSPDDWEHIMNINARAPFFLMQYSIPLLKKADPGFIINIGSVVAHKGYENQALYSASKHALLGYTKATAREFKETNIRIHAINPGGVNTDLVKSVRPDIDTTDMISPEEIAETVKFLLRMKGNAMIDEISVRRRTKKPWD
ncbi:MAG: SDR family NAD(P)-dependent oxidoreductase [Spirochaetales bacterium]|uniref:SDR family NAD(P)-dependent oxidoreductase n=1 Tax=Candidatus Thalassospirochaeta sargassi TaxID=3119039 RepID=A0AAJ1IHG2_9SPIO|nr:SDR family NAD(P)-dependent oxidoreductase [Spirochaetales bacterium]